MIWAVLAILIGLAIGVAAVLLLARPDSIRSTRKPPPRKQTAPEKPVAPAVQAKRSPAKRSPVDRAISGTQPGLPPAPAVPTRDRTPGADRPVDFPEAALRAAWRRQGGLCAHCGRLLIWANRNRDSGIGAWQSHHRTPRDQGGSSDLKNCVLFCSGAGNCHYNIGHGGIIGWTHYSTLDDSTLLYLRHGAEKANGTAPQTRARPGLLRQMFGIGGSRKAKSHSSSKPKSKPSRPSLPLQDDYDEAY